MKYKKKASAREKGQIISPTSEKKKGQVRCGYCYQKTFWRSMAVTGSPLTFSCVQACMCSVIRVSSRAQHSYNSKKAPRRNLAKSLPYPVGKFIFPGVNGEWGILGFILLNCIFSKFCSKRPRLSGVDAYKLKLIELVLLFLPQANTLRIHDHICSWNLFLTIRDLNLRA